MKYKKIADAFFFGGTASLLLISTVLYMYSWGRYVFFLIIAALSLIYIGLSGGRIRLIFGTYHKSFFAFALYSGLSALWASNSSYSISMMVTLLSLIVCYYPIYEYYHRYGNFEHFIGAIKWGGILVSGYTILYYGVDTLMKSSLSSSLRLDTDFANPNTLGIIAAVTVFIQTWQVMYHKGNRIEVLACVPSIIVIGAAQSRKSIVLVVVGVFLMVIIKNLYDKSALIRIGKTLISIALVIVILYGVSQLEIFDGVIHRIEGLINSFTGAGKVDNSTIVRNALIKVGIDGWKTSPIIGIGIGNPRILAKQYLGMNAYLHNNYVEMLCGGGLLGIAIYYTWHINTISKLLKYKNNQELLVLFATWIVLILIMDYGMVSYYGKHNHLYYVLISLGTQIMEGNKK